MASFWACRSLVEGSTRVRMSVACVAVGAIWTGVMVGPTATQPGCCRECLPPGDVHDNTESRRAWGPALRYRGLACLSACVGLQRRATTPSIEVMAAHAWGLRVEAVLSVVVAWFGAEGRQCFWPCS
mmetsp:Transcript_52673/g.139980  ORF Transcript_52673/g.139980 Transcript_52673/m.139980 type:complete len:127 (-) Transcript_52673:276-656(-)